MAYLSGHNVRLTSIEPEDLTVLLTVENDTEEWIQSDNYVPFSRSVMEKYASGDHDLLKYGQYRLMIRSAEDSSTLGCIDLFNYHAIHSRAGVGIYLLEKYRGKGFAKEALHLLIQYAAEVLNIELLYCSILDSNLASIAVFSSQGFEQTGTRPGWSKIKGVRKKVLLLQRQL